MKLLAASPDYAEIWHQWRHEPSCLRHNPIVDLDLNEVRSRLGDLSSDLSDRSCTEYRWFVERDGVLVGTVALTDVDWRHGHGEIGYQVGEAFEGRGIGTAATVLVVEKVFAETELRKLVATIASDNIASRRIVEGLGFSHEGTLRQQWEIQGRLVDQATYGLLRSEWVSSAS